ncbi:MAG: hypothetical protein WD558_07815, partial [Pseudomonadales bacterium]
MSLSEILTSGERARLIPAGADTNKEAKAASILLATLQVVPSFQELMLNSLGRRVGTRAKLQCYTEVTFKKSSKIRPDGLIYLDSGGGRAWTCLVEAKIKNAKIEKDQIERYMELAKDQQIDAVLTISNEFVASPTHSPIQVSKTLKRNVGLFHWSWMFMLTQAQLLLNSEKFEDVEQRFILDEMGRYFSHPSIGISTFNRMNPEWKELVTKIQSGANIAKSEAEVENSVAAWHQEVRDLCLLMTRKLNRRVQVHLNRTHNDDPVKRLKDDSEKLVQKKVLTCTLDVPDAASPIEVTADLLRRSLTVSMNLAAPKDKQRTTSRVNWLTRQLAKAHPDNIHIKASWPGRAPATQEKLEILREDASRLDTNQKAQSPTSFDVMLVRDAAGKFSGNKTFIEQLEEVVPYFYEQIGQHLRAYVAPPPRIKR